GGFDQIPDGRGRGYRADIARQSAKSFLPEGDFGGEGGITRKPLLRLAPARGIEHAKHVFGRGEIAVFAGDGRIVAHACRQLLSFINPRRMILFMVPSGMSARRASSSYVLPSRKAARMAPACRGSSSSRQLCSRRY